MNDCINHSCGSEAINPRIVLVNQLYIFPCAIFSPGFVQVFHTRMGHTPDDAKQTKEQSGFRDRA